MAPPDNRIDKLLPVWPTLPVKPSGGKPGETERSGERERRGRREPQEQETAPTVDDEGHIDFYA